MNFQINSITPATMIQASVLIVDDLEANRTLMNRRLEKFGYEVHTADGGQAALAMLEKITPDIILLDYMMPQMNGLEVLDILRSRSSTRDIPVIMVTARAEAEAVVEALDSGVDDYVTKPIDFDVLRARMDTHIEKRKNVSNMAIANSVLDQRVTLRSMALADMDSELQNEIKKRQQLEQKLASNQIIPAQPAEHSVQMLEQLHLIEKQLDELFALTASGQACNPAKILQIKSSVAFIINGL